MWVWCMVYNPHKLGNIHLKCHKVNGLWKRSASSTGCFNFREEVPSTYIRSQTYLDHGHKEKNSCRGQKSNFGSLQSTWLSSHAPALITTETLMFRRHTNKHGNIFNDWQKYWKGTICTRKHRLSTYILCTLALWMLLAVYRVYAKIAFRLT
jgi:hypothetical protein